MPDSKPTDQFTQDIVAWLELPRKDREAEVLADRLGVPPAWVSELELAAEQFQSATIDSGGVAAAAGSKVTISPPVGGDEIGKDEEVLVVLDRLAIRRLYTDFERTERGNQEGQAVFSVNGQTTTLSWERNDASINRWNRSWDAYDSDQKTLLYMGVPAGLLDIDLIVTESDKPEQQFFERIAELLKSAATFAGFVPGAGSAVSAAFNLGSAIANLIKARIQDDPEMRFLGTVGGREVKLSTGTYVIKRHSLDGATPDIEAHVRVEKFVRSEDRPSAVKIHLEDVQFANEIQDLQVGDRLLLDITVSDTPTDQEAEPRVGTLKVDRPYKGQNGDTWPKTLGIKDKLIYQGEWGKNIALTFNVAGIPREINREEWHEVIQQTAAFIGAVSDPADRPGIQQGFKIVEAVSATVIKFLPDRQFESSVATALYVPKDGAAAEIAGLKKLQNTGAWQQIQVTLDLGRYGLATFVLQIQLTL